MGHARIWAKEHPIFTPLWLAVYNKNLKTKELQTQYVDKLSEVFTTVIQKQEYKILLEKAFEISQQVVGRIGYSIATCRNYKRNVSRR